MKSEGPKIVYNVSCRGSASLLSLVAVIMSNLTSCYSNVERTTTMVGISTTLALDRCASCVMIHMKEKKWVWG
jgi:hypothetical protein